MKAQGTHMNLDETNKQSLSLAGDLARRLVAHALTVLDHKDSLRAGYNPNALARYCELADDIGDAVASGESLRTAAVTRCCDRVLACVLRALGEKPPTSDESSGVLMRPKKGGAS